MIEMTFFPFQILFSLNKSARKGTGLLLPFFLFFSLTTAAWATEDSGVVADTGDSLVQMAESAENEVASHRAQLANLNEQLRQFESALEELHAQIKGYDIQNTAHGQLLLKDKIQTRELGNAIRENRLASKALTENIERFQRDLDSKTIDFETTLERIELSRQQILDIRQSDLPRARKRQLLGPMQQLFQTLEDKKRIEERILKICYDLLGQASAALEAKTAVGDKLTAALEKLQKTSATQRMNPYRDLGNGVLLDDLRSLKDRILAVFRFDTWKALWHRSQTDGLIPWAILIVASAVIIAFGSRVRRFLMRIEDKCEGAAAHCHYRRLCLLLLRRSLTYTALTLLFRVYISFEFSLFDIGFVRFLFNAFFVLLVVHWGMDFIEHGLKHRQTALRGFVSLHLNRILGFLRIATITVLFFSLLTGRDSLLTWTTKNIVMAVLLVLAEVFWRQMKPIMIAHVREGGTLPGPGRIALMRGVTYLALAGALITNLAGYSMLAGQWLRSWADSVVIAFWGWMIFKVLEEFHRHFRDGLATAGRSKPETSRGHLRWSMLQIAWGVWVATLTVVIVRAWDPSGLIWSLLGRFFAFTFTAGSLNFSVKGVFLAIFILFITHLFLRVGRSLLKEKVLDKRSIERGLKDSVLTIVSYLGWALGLVLALGLVGVNTASLAVVFGALSIGIGFGLQNIFNNFISGLILLFERPIQVGDYVEIGGIWAEVKKINVRSTVVQTFDNASVIIPNSEFISQQVTNWSFKDKRMRRSLDVGVAYGSDIELVQKTMTNIALETPGVLKYPRPDVIFVDHADSALIFRLRVWIDADDYWAVSSRIRCDIDRRFNELAIEIAFPQRDLHIRTMPRQTENVAGPDKAHPEDAPNASSESNED